MSSPLVGVLLRWSHRAGDHLFRSAHTDLSAAVRKLLRGPGNEELLVLGEGCQLFDDDGNFTPRAITVERVGTETIEVSRYNPDSLGHLVPPNSVAILTKVYELALGD